MAIHQNKLSGTWRVQIRTQGFAPISKSFKLKRDAEVFETIEKEKQITHSPSRDRKEARTTTVGEWFIRYIEHKFVKPLTEAQEQDLIKVNSLVKKAKFMDKRLDQISTIDIQKYRDARLTAVSKATVAREIGTLNGVFKYLIAEMHAPLNNPMTGVTKPKDFKVIRTTGWTNEQVQAILDATNFNPEVRPILKKDFVGWALLLSLETAMRKGELRKITAQDFNAEQQYVFIKYAKNKDSRYCPLTQVAVNILKVLTKGLAPHESVFPLSSSHLHNEFVEAKTKAGLNGQNLLLHGARHEAITRAVPIIGSNLLELQAFSGHRDLRSLAGYVHLAPSAIAQKLDSFKTVGSKLKPPVSDKPLDEALGGGAAPPASWSKRG
jgi:integrase